MSDTRTEEKWGPGIPKYTDDDVMDRQQLLDFAMDLVMEKEIRPGGYEVTMENRVPGKISYIFKKDGRHTLLLVKPFLYDGEMIGLSTLEKKNLDRVAGLFKGRACYIRVGIRPKDPERAEAGLLLKDDEWEIVYSGMQDVRFKKSAEWIEHALDEIDALAPEEETPEDPDVVCSFRKEQDEKIRFSLPEKPVGDPTSDFNKWKNELNTPTFQEMLLMCISKKGMTNVAFYKAAYMDRKLFSAIKNDRYYRPKKGTAVACCFGLELKLPDAEELLKMAGFSLSLAIPWDRTVYYCLEKEIYDLDVVNELLYEEGQRCIGVID